MSLDRDDLPGVLMTAAVAAGLGWYFLQPERVSTVVGVAHGVGHPTVVLAGWTVALCVAVVGTMVWWWGPVRLSRAEAVWHLSGPGDRGPILHARRIRASIATVIGCLVTAGIVTILDWSSAPALLGVGAVCALIVLVVTTWHQHRSGDRLSGRVQRGRSRWSVRGLHRDTFAPDDGFIAAARLAAVTMDLGWLDTARAVRWGLSHAGLRSRRLPQGRVRSCLAADLARLRRRPGDLAIWLITVAAAVAVPSTLYLTSIAPAIATVLAYRAGCAVAGGLRRLTEAPALRRTLGGSDSELTAIHSVAPVTGVLLCCGVIALTWHLSTLAVVVIAVGSAVATVRRATRPDLPFDAPVYITGQGGAAQPLLLLAMLRGPAAVAITGVVAMLIG